MFHDYSINFLSLVVLQCDAMNIISLTGVLKNSEDSGQALLKETFFIFSLAFLLNDQTIFRNYIRDYIISIPPKNRSLSQMKRKINL